ncbi:ABC-2 type transporter-domain-containing protein [Lactifluus volemus]|nr:ABC-2 type transporter-domain-containing protein [Lactifluus volemus]
MSGLHRSISSTPTAGSVNVDQAKTEFHELSRQLTQGTVTGDNERGIQSAPTCASVDLEKGHDTSDSEQPFDLREYLTSSNDANEAAGIKHKHVGVIWEDLHVDVIGGSNFKLHVRTVEVSPIQSTTRLSFVDESWQFWLTPFFKLNSAISSHLPSRIKKVATSTILHRSSGLLEPGQMCLVLGTPGSGCNTFLKAIANEREGFYHVGGDIQYAGIDAQEMAKTYKGELVYNAEDDIHIPTLTVGQTMNFALSTKTPGPKGRLPGVSRSAFNVSVKNMLLKMLNMSHTENTLVGDSFVRGVSGGERKRVSIAEMMTTRARVQCWDNSSRGLDASTALDFARSLRIMTDVLGQTTFATLYQAGEGIYELFDKVMVMDQGHTVYFGPPDQARAYFEQLGYRSLLRQSTADYLTGCTDPNERQFAPGRSEADVPSTPTALEAAFRSSDLARDVDDQLAKFKIRMETEKADQDAFRAASPYTLGLKDQVIALTRRQFQMRLQDKFQIYNSYGFMTMPVQMLGRPITKKQTGYGFYRPAAVQIANVLADMPFSATRILIYDIIIYFMSHLDRSAGRFFTIFRTIGLFCSNYHTAFRVAVSIFPNLILYAGYMIPVSQMKRWLFWISYINPVNYAWSALMKNEFQTLNLTCDGAYIVPHNAGNITKYPAELGPNQVCTLFGAKSASAIVPGRDYVKIGYDLMDFVVLVVFLLFFWFTQTVVIEIFPQLVWSGGISFFAKETSETKKLNEELKARKEQKAEEERLEKIRAMDGIKRKKDLGDFTDRRVFTWERVNYHVPVGGGSLQLLNNVYGYVKPGTLTALMGASGAGKTTCLDVLAQRKNIGVVSGDIFVDGRPLDANFARGTAYAEQMDVHEGNATVREAMRFSAYLRQPFHVPKEEKDAYVEDMIELLELQDLSEAVIWSLDVEARKRLTIGVELASKPELLLFLDEPTSGLDAQSAWNLVRFLRKLADSGQAILCTIHQPSSLLFESFDRLLLLGRGGNTIYFGDIGEDSQVMREYFARNGAKCPSNVNPAEYMLEAIGAGITPRIGDRDWKDIWLDSPEFARTRADIEEIKRKSLAHDRFVDTNPSAYATPLWYQVKLVVARNALSLWRSPAYIFTRLFSHLIVSLMVSLPFLQLGNSTRDLQYRVFGIFWVIVLPGLVIPQLEPIFLMNRGVFIREASSRIYSPYVFAVGQLLGEIPYSVVCAIIYWALMVYPMHFGQGSAGTNGTGFQLLVVLITELFAVSLGQLIASITPSIQIAALFTPPIQIVLSNMCGVTIPYPALITFWRSWLYQLDPFTRMLGAMLSTELHGLKITCKPDEFAVFNPPSGQTCAAWAGDFVNAVSGYIDNPNDTAGCRYCQYAVGDEFFLPLNIKYNHRWRDVGIFFCFFVFNFVATIIASRYLRFARR